MNEARSSPKSSVRSFKIHFPRRRVRIAISDSTAGVDVTGDRTRTVFEATDGLVAWLLARDPTARVRAFYVHPHVPRAIVSLEAPDGAQERPWVLRLEGSDAESFLAAAPDLLRIVTAEAEATVRRRA